MATEEERRAREERLPRWARIELERLRNNVAYLTDKVTAGPEGSDTVADPHLHPKPLGLGETVCFQLNPGDNHPSRRILVRMRPDGVLEVNGGNPIAVMPSAGNAIEVHLLHTFNSDRLMRRGEDK